jgi:integrase
MIDPYLRYVRNHQSDKTYRDKKWMIYSNLLHFFGNMVPDFIDRQTIDIYKEKRIEEIKKGGRHKGNRAVNLEILCLQALVNWGHEYGYCSEPLVRTKKLPYKRPLPNPLTDDETMQFIDSMKQCKPFNPNPPSKFGEAELLAFSGSQEDYFIRNRP